MRRCTRFDTGGLLAAGAAVLLVAGCGSSSSNSTSSSTKSTSTPQTQPQTQPPTQPTSADTAFTAQVTTACRTANQEVGAVPKPAPGNLAADIAYLEKTTPILESLHGKLSAITPPPEKQAGYSKFLSDVEKEVSLAKELAPVSKEHNQQRARAITTENTSNLTELHTLASQLGIEECAKAEGGESTTSTETSTTGSTPSQTP